MIRKINVTSTHLNDGSFGLSRYKAYGVRSNGEFPLPFSLSILISTILHELTYTIKAAYRNFIPFNRYITLDPQIKKDGLVVFFYGLNGKTSLWSDHLYQFKKEEEKNKGFSLAYYTPLLPNNGHCTLNDKGIDQIVEKIENWIVFHPHKPVVLLGQSNGSRIALEIETRLRERASENPVFLSLTGPVLYGTSLINIITKIVSPYFLSKITFGLLTPLCVEELKLGSESSKTLLTKARRHLPQGCAERRYRLYAPALDSHVWEKGSALPILNAHQETLKNEKHYLVLGYGHDSIVNALTEEQVEKSFRWMMRKNSLSKADAH